MDVQCPFWQISLFFFYLENFISIKVFDLIKWTTWVSDLITSILIYCLYSITLWQYYIRYINITLYVDIYHQRYRLNKRFVNFQDEELNCNSKLFGFMLVMDSDNIMAIIWHKVIPSNNASYCINKTLWLFWNGGYVERFKAKDSNPMVMFGWKWVLEYGR